MFPSAAAAWRALGSGVSASPPLHCGASTPAQAEVCAPRSEALLSLLLSLSISVDLIPPHVRTLVRAATSAECPPEVRAAAGFMISCEAVRAEPVAYVHEAVVSSPAGGDEAACAREIRELRLVLPRECEMQMLGSRGAYEQATRAIREDAIASEIPCCCRTARCELCTRPPCLGSLPVFLPQGRGITAMACVLTHFSGVH